MAADDQFGTDIAFVSDFVPTASGDLDVTTGLANLQEALFRRLITVPGSLNHRPTYGVGLKNFQNSLNSLPNQQAFAALVAEQFAQDPRVDSVTGVAINSSDDNPEHVEIVVTILVVGYGETAFNFLNFGDA